MKKIILSVIVLCFCGSLVEAQSIKLPSECKSVLDKNFRGWKLAKIQKEISDYHQEKKLAYLPNFIKGDWNGDGESDYAVLIEQGKLKNGSGEVYKDRRLIIAFVKNRSGFKHFQFDGADSIGLMRKGSIDYNYETGKKFRYKTDAISNGFWEKSSESYIWRRRKFVRITTGD